MAAQPGGGGGIFDGNSTKWVVFDSAMNGYLSVALLRAAGTPEIVANGSPTPTGIEWPGLDAGMFPEDAIWSADNGSGAVAAGQILIAYNKGAAFAALANDAARDRQAYIQLVAGSGQSLSKRFLSRPHNEMVWNFWARKATGTDRLWIGLNL